MNSIARLDRLEDELLQARTELRWAARAFDLLEVIACAGPTFVPACDALRHQARQLLNEHPTREMS